MNTYLKSAVIALALTVSAVTAAEAQEHWHGGGGHYGHDWHGGHGWNGYPHWHGPVVAGRVYAAYPYPYAYYPPAYYPPVVPVYPAPGVSVGMSFR